MFDMSVVLATKYIDVNMLRREHPKFDARLHQAVRDAAHSSRDMEEAGFAVANALVHPLYCSLRYRQPFMAMQEYPHNYEPFQMVFCQQQQDPYYHYQAYKERLECALRITTFPVFCFVADENRDRVEEWLNSLSLQVPVIMVKTKAGNPLPLLEGIGEQEEDSMWRAVAGILRGVGVNIIPVMGELHYSSEGEIEGLNLSFHVGCAGKVADVLEVLKDEYMFHTVMPVPGYTYPGFVYRPPDLKQFMNEMANRTGKPRPF
jgi:hypothetical protein